MIPTHTSEIIETEGFISREGISARQHNSLLQLQRGSRMASLLQRVSSQAKLVSSKSKSHLLPALATCSQQRNLSVHEHVSMSLLQVSSCILPFFLTA